MTTLEQTRANEQKVGQAQDAWRRALGEGLRRGFFGTVAVEVCIQDGTIQKICRRVEQMEK